MHTLKALNCVSSYFSVFGLVKPIFTNYLRFNRLGALCSTPPRAAAYCRCYLLCRCAWPLHLHLLPVRLVVPVCATSTCCCHICRCCWLCCCTCPLHLCFHLSFLPPACCFWLCLWRSLRLRCPQAACRCGDARVAVCAPAPPPRAAHMPAAVLPLPLVPLSASACRPPACRWLCTFVPRLRLRVLPTCLPPCCLCRWPLPCLSHFILRLSTYFAPLNTQHRLLSACCPPSWCCPRYHWRIRASPACLNSMLRHYNTQHRTQIHNTTRACPHACTAAHLRAVVVTPALPFVPRLRVLSTCLSLRCSLI